MEISLVKTFHFIYGGGIMFIPGAENIRIKVVAVFNRAVDALRGEEDVKILEGKMTVVKCLIKNGQATIPEKIANHPDFQEKTRMGRIVEEKVSPIFALTAVENSKLRDVGNKLVPDWSTVPVLPNGKAPVGTVPKNAKHNSGRPTGYVNHVNEIIVINVNDIYQKGKNIEHISGVHFNINPETGKLEKKTIFDRTPVDIETVDWKKQITKAVGKKFFDATAVAINLAWGDVKEYSCPAWIKPEPRKEKPKTEISKPGNGEIGTKTVKDVLQQKEEVAT